MTLLARQQNSITGLFRSWLGNHRENSSIPNEAFAHVDAGIPGSIRETLPIEPEIEEIPIYRPESVAAACAVEIIPMLGNQLRSVAQDLEVSVVDVCKGFQGISQRSRDLVSQAESAIGTNDHQNGSGQTIARAHTVLEQLLANVQASCEFSQVQGQRIHQLETQLQLVEKSLKEVEEISNKAKLVSLNGQIEAARLGDQGKAFGVVADETKNLAANASQTSNKIQALITDLGATLRSTASDLEKRTKQDFNVLAESQSSVREMLCQLQNAHTTMSTSFLETTNLSRQMQKDISQSVMAMQFQDRLNQRVDHVVASLEMLVSELQPFHEIADPVELQSKVRLWSEEFARRATMDAERDGLETNGVSTPVSSETEFSVELF